jgi:hypothetical protein
VTVDWQGDGPFDGRIYGSVHVREKDDLCAAAYAWYCIADLSPPVSL